MHTLLIVLHVIFCVFLILVILLQTGKGAGIGAAFGGGSSQTVFGPRGAGSFIGKLTGVVAALFMLSSLTLAYLSSSTATGLAEKVRERGLGEHSGQAQDVDLEGLMTQSTDEEAASTDAGVNLDTAQPDTMTVTDIDTMSAEPLGTDAVSSGAPEDTPKVAAASPEAAAPE